MAIGMNRKTISIYEDDQTIREMYEVKLRHSGFGVHAHPDARNVVQKVKHEKPDLVLMDILMPEVDGHAAIKQLKEDEETAKIPVLVITNFGDDVTVQKALWFGAHDVVVKANNTPQQIVERIKDTLDGRPTKFSLDEKLIHFLHIDSQARPERKP